MIEQIAIACKDPENTKRFFQSVLGINQWHRDVVVSKGDVFPFVNPCDEYSNKAELNLNYELGKFEFALVTYKDGKNWLQDVNTREDNFLSHFGLYIDEPDKFKEAYEKLKSVFKIAQDMVTQRHLNEDAKGKFRFRNVVFNSRDELGFDIKIIQKLDLEGEPYIESKKEKIIKCQNRMHKLKVELMKEEKILRALEFLNGEK